MTTARKSYGLQPIEQKLGNVLQPLFHGSKKEFLLISNLAKNWSTIVGNKYASLCYPKSCTFAKTLQKQPNNFDDKPTTNSAKKTSAKSSSQGKLTIAVSNPAIGFFLESNADLIIERLAVFCGYKLINKIIIKQEPKEAEHNNAPNIKLNDEQKRFLEQNLQNLENSDLKQVLEKIGSEIIGNKSNQSS